MSKFKLRSDSKAMCVPSGDQLGQSSWARWSVTSCTLPSVFMSQMSYWPSRRSLTKAIRAGIGANGAAVSRQPASAALPAASETVNGSKDFIERLLVSWTRRNYAARVRAANPPLDASGAPHDYGGRSHAGALAVPTRAPHARLGGAARVG